MGKNKRKVDCENCPDPERQDTSFVEGFKLVDQTVSKTDYARMGS